MNENIQAYVILIHKGKMTLEQVPEEFREQVSKFMEDEEA